MTKACFLLRHLIAPVRTVVHVDHDAQWCAAFSLSLGRSLIETVVTGIHPAEVLRLQLRRIILGHHLIRGYEL